MSDPVIESIPPANGTSPSGHVTAAALATVRDATMDIVRILQATATFAMGGSSLAKIARALVPELAQAHAEREVLGTELETLRARLAEDETRACELAKERAEADARWHEERVALEADLAHEREQTKALAHDLGRRRVELETLERRERELRDQVQTSTRAATDREETLRLAREMVQAAEDARLGAVAELDRARSELDAARAELAGERERLAEIQHDRAQAAHAATALEAELTSARAVIAELRPRIADLEEQVRTLQAKSERLEVPPSCGDAAEQVSHVDELAEMQDDAPPSSAATPEEVRERSATSFTLVILDPSEGWETPPGLEAQRIEPGPAACDGVRELSPDCCLLNLAAPGVLAAAAALRADKIAVRLWGCAIGANGNGAVSLGVVDVVPRPIDPQSVHAQFAALAPPGARVVMVGSDGAALIPLREGLLQAGMSVRTAWDLKQAGELADAVRPQVIIVDLASQSAAAAEFVVDLARRDPAPRIVVIPGPPQSLEEFAVALAAIAATSGPVARADLLRAAAGATANGD